jgi:hypothetical protein
MKIFFRLIFLLLLLSESVKVDEVHRLKHQQNEKHRFSTFYDDNGVSSVGSVNNILVQKCFVFLRGQQGK